MSAILLGIVLSSGGASAREGDLKQEFLARYGPAARRLADFYTDVMLRARTTTEAYKEGQTQAYEYIYRANDGLLRLDEIGYDNAGTIARVADPSGAGFVVRRPTDGEHFSLLHLQGNYGARERLIRQFAPLPFDAYSAVNIDLVEYIRLPAVRVTSLTSETTGTETLQRLVFERDMSQGRKQIGTFLFAPEDCWAVRQGELRLVSRGNSNRWTIEYRGRRDGVPLVHKLERLWADQDGKPIGRALVEVSELVPGPIPKEDFTLAAFGISDAGLKPAVPPWYYLQLVAVIALTAAVVFWQVSKRRRAAASPPAAAEG